MKETLLIVLVVACGVYCYILPDIYMITRSIAFIISAFVVSIAIGSLAWAYVWHVQKRMED